MSTRRLSLALVARRARRVADEIFAVVRQRPRVKNAKLRRLATRGAMAGLVALAADSPGASTAAAQDVPPPPPVPAVAPTAPKTPAAPPPPVLPKADATVGGSRAVPPPGAGDVRVRIVTALGAIVVDLDRAHAPLTTANFLNYVDQHRFDGTGFYRADKVDAASGLGLVQGGVRGDPKKILPPVAHERTTKTGLAHVEGTISMARLAPGSARGDFFITTGPLSSLDAHPQAAGDNAGFAAFGHVVDGMAVVHRILDAPVSDAGEGAMRGQLLVKPVRIVTVRRGG